MPESFPTTFGRYTLIERLGMGGMAEVFLAEVAGPAAFSKRVVVKRLLPELTSDREVVARFLEEARLSAKFSHPNVVQVFELGDVEGDYFIAMEYVAGADLRKIERLLWPSCAEVPIGIAAAVVAAVCRGLEHVHTLTENGTPLGIVHRDVSPSNVLLSFEGGVKLIDFGVARAHAHARITRHGTAIMGKLVYASPEQVLGLAVTPRSDLFSAGCLLYEALTSVRPFERDNEPATLHAITREVARPPSELRPHLPKALDDVVLRALCRNPADRWPTAGQMAQALEAFVADRAQLIGTPQIAGFVRAALEDQDALTVTRMGESRLEKQLRGGTPGAAVLPAGPSSPPRARRTSSVSPSAASAPAPSAPAVLTAPPGLEELPTIVEPDASSPAVVAPAPRRVSSARGPAVPGPSDWEVDGPPTPPPGLEEDLPTSVQAAAEGRGGGAAEGPVEPRRPTLPPGPPSPPPGLEEVSTAVVPPDSVAALAASMDVLTPGSSVRAPTQMGVGAAPRPRFGVPEGMPSDTVIEGEEPPAPTTSPDVEDELGDLPAEPTRIDASRDLLGASPDGVPGAVFDEDEDDDHEDLSSGRGVAFVPPPVAEERVRMQYAPTVSAMPSYSVQPGGPLVSSPDASSAAPTFAILPPSAAAMIATADASTAAPTVAATPRASALQIAEEPTAAPHAGAGAAAAPAPGTEWGESSLGALVPVRRPIPIAFLAIAGAVAILTGILVAVALSGDDDEAAPPTPHAVPMPPAPLPQAPGVPSATPPREGPRPAPPPPAPVAPATTETRPAPVPVAPPPPAAAEERPRPAKRRDIGRLRLTSSPRGVVEIDGVRAGMTPLIGYPLPAGPHRVRVFNERLGKSATLSIRIKAGRVVAKNIRLRRNPRMPRR